MPISSAAPTRSRISRASRPGSTGCRRGDPNAGAAPVLPDVLVPGLALVFCGTAPSPTSAARGAYYAGPGNRFWDILAETGLTPRLLAPEDYPVLPQFGIGLTDIAKCASGMDVAIPANAYDAADLARR